nr:hypothetical protein [uncultured Microbacterium sp.]
MKGLAQTLVLTGAVRAADLSAAIDKVGDGPELSRSQSHPGVSARRSNRSPTNKSA